MTAPLARLVAMMTASTTANSTASSNSVPASTSAQSTSNTATMSCGSIAMHSDISAQLQSQKQQMADETHLRSSSVKYSQTQTIHHLSAEHPHPQAQPQQLHMNRDASKRRSWAGNLGLNIVDLLLGPAASAHLAQPSMVLSACHVPGEALNPTPIMKTTNCLPDSCSNHHAAEQTLLHGKDKHILIRRLSHPDCIASVPKLMSSISPDDPSPLILLTNASAESISAQAQYTHPTVASSSNDAAFGAKIETVRTTSTKTICAQSLTTPASFDGACLSVTTTVQSDAVKKSLSSPTSTLADGLTRNQPKEKLQIQVPSAQDEAALLHETDCLIQPLNIPARSPLHQHSHQQRSQTTSSIAEIELSEYHLLPEFLERYSLIGELGHGATGFVMVAERIEDGEQVAVKFLYKNRIPVTSWKRDRSIGFIPLEAFLLRRISHPNVIQFLDIFEDAKYCYLIMEMHGTQWKNSHIQPDIEPSSMTYRQHRHSTNPFQHCPTTPTYTADVASPLIAQTTPPAIDIPYFQPHIPPTSFVSPAPHSQLSITARQHTRHSSLDLFEYIENNPFFAERKIRHIFLQVAQAVCYLHQNNIVHNDIKDENIVIDENLHVKLIDFGAAQTIPSHPRDYFEKFRGTAYSIPPEGIRGEAFRGPEVDVWCTGILLYTMSFSCFPFRTTEDILTASFRHPRFKRSAALIDLIHCMLQVDAKKRYTIEQVLHHSWLTTPEK
ncbi:hypothetical protein QVD99_002689 [Batrachochytrium dendrobatidis]|nr:hypothetical protein O5D80_006912 [Batrachochytrium dendrobatidis]KAK5670918.1 hypothetical protein QVD99_002689 [Batrachochytrium dendrobatidis]